MASIGGSPSNDSLTGTSDADSISAGAGDDTLHGGAGADQLNGDRGLGYADYTDSGAGVYVNLATWSASGGDAAGDTLSGIDGIYGSAYNDTITGFNASSNDPYDAYTNIFYGNAGYDLMDGADSDDSLYGGADSDTVLGGAGNDLVDGGTGDDTLSDGDGDDTLLGGDGNDLLEGGVGNNFYDAGTGSDTIVAANGSTGTIIGAEDADNSDVDVLVVNRHQGAVTSDPNDAEAGTITWRDGSSVTFSNIENIQIVPCFTPGTMIETKRGLVAVENLRLGNRVMTRDNGYRPIRWIGRRTVTAADLALRPQLQPVLIRKGALGDGLPEADMVVSPQHRMLISGVRAELLFGEPEVLAAALHMVGQPGIERLAVNAVTYLHLMFDAHEIIRADGAWTESFQPGDQMLSGLDAAQREEIMAIFPDLRHPQRRNLIWSAARLSLKPHEVRVLLAA